MRIKNLLFTGTLLAGSILASTTALADWQLANEQSQLTFLSTKNAKVTEQHQLKSMSGKIDASGNATVLLDLSSVETGIDIRNQRMLEHLFEVSKFATATATLSVPKSALSLKAGQLQNVTLDFKVNLHGVTQTLPIAVTITGLQGGDLHVQSVTPVIVSSQAFGLDTGIEMLRTLAKLDNIVTSVPVSFALTFKAEK